MNADWESAGSTVADAGGWEARENAPERTRPRALAPPTTSEARSRRLLAKAARRPRGARPLHQRRPGRSRRVSERTLRRRRRLTAIGRVSAMSGTYLLLVTLLLIARIPAVERAIGQDRLVRLHRRLGPAVLGLIGVHVVSVVVGYAAQVATGPWHELVVMAATFPGMMLAVAGFGLLLLAGSTSYRYVRRKMKYETWWAVHLYMYLAVALSIPHQILTGAPFIGHPLATAWWLTLWFATAGAVIVYRWGLPIARSLHHGVTVHSVEEEAPGVVSVTMAGRHLDKLEAAGGQFLHWRFLKRGMWWQAHPYSLSALPTANRLRITVKDLGDHSGSLADHRARDARGDRRPLRSLHAARAAHRPRRAGRGRRRRHARQGAPRGPAAARGRGRDPARPQSARPRPPRRARPPGRASATGGSTSCSGRARTPGSTSPASPSSCPTSSTATCTSAARAASCETSSTPPAAWAYAASASITRTSPSRRDRTRPREET